jgi:uncharacterized membrane protein
MARNWTGTPHRIALVVAGVAVLVGIGLLISPWDGPVVPIAWVLIVAAVVTTAVTLFLVRTPRS